MRKIILGGLLLFLTSVAYEVCPALAAEFVPIVHSEAYESSHVITTNPSKHTYWITVTWTGAAATRYLIIYNSTTVPTDGPLTPANILYCAVVSLASDGAVGTKSFDFTQHPLQYNAGPPATTALGQVAIISTDSSGCDTKTADGNNDWITAGFN